MPIYMTSDYRDAFDYLEVLLTLKPNTKQHQIFVKQVGSRHRHYYYDQRFADALLVEDVDSDEFFEEKTTDEKASVQIHQPNRQHKVVRAVWRGIHRNEGIRSEDEIPF